MTPAPDGLPALSPRNRRVGELARLARSRRARDEAGLFVLDGPVLLGEALASGVTVQAVYADPAAVDRPEVAAALDRAAAAAVPAWTVTGGLRGHLAVTTPHGLAAVARIPARPGGPTALGATSPAGNPPLHVVLVGVTDPGNVGTLLRTAEAVGATSVVLTDGAVDPWSPKVVRASAGSVLRVPLHRGPAPAVLDQLGRAGVTRVGARARDGVAPDQVDLSGPVALVLGSEAHGLPDEAAAAVDAWVALPMRGAVESLNVAVAGSVLAFEAVRQRSRPDRSPAATMEP